jgi:serine/threonine-protein kinase RsbT
VITLSWHIEGGDFETAGLATRRLKEQLARAGVGAQAMRRAMIAAYEAEMNVVIHARTGTLWARVDNGRLDLEVADEGPGIPDVALALREGWSTASESARAMGFGAGLGLPNIKRSSDLFEIETRVGRGTRIRSTILLEAAGAGPAPVPEFAPPTVNGESCRHCMHCITACPVSALRVRAGGPVPIEALCVGCAACARACEAGVYGIPGAALLPPVPKGAVLVAPRGFLSGIPVPGGPAQAAAALRSMGFAELRLLEEWESALRDDAGRAAGSLPVIPAFCPPVVALVESRFPSLLPQLGPWLSPAEAAGEEFPLAPLFLVAACPGQAAAVSRASLTDRLTVVPPKTLLAAMLPHLQDAVGHAGSALPDAVPPSPGTLRARGPAHVLRALAEAEAGRLSGVRLLELALCEGGCSGSPYMVDDLCLAELRWRSSPAVPSAAAPAAAAVARSRPFAPRPGLRLDADMAAAIRKLARIDALTRSLPGRDCGACGAPTCAAFAEDVVLERAGSEACPHVKELS